MVDDAALSNHTEGGTTKEVVESVWNMDLTNRTLKRTPKLVTRIGKKPMRMLIAFGAIGNYISTQECAARRIKIERDHDGKELAMANGSSVKTLN